MSDHFSQTISLSDDRVGQVLALQLTDGRTDLIVSSYEDIHFSFLDSYVASSSGSYTDVGGASGGQGLFTISGSASGTAYATFENDGPNEYFAISPVTGDVTALAALPSDPGTASNIVGRSDTVTVTNISGANGTAPEYEGPYTLTVSPPSGNAAYLPTTFGPVYLDDDSIHGPSISVAASSGGEFVLLEQGDQAYDASVLLVGQLDAAPAVACFASGTCILTDRGEIAVEELKVGDDVLTLLGQGFSPITWIGSRTLRPATQPKPGAAYPVRIRAGAFGAGRPKRDLVVSPGHALYFDGVLIQAEMLVNGQSVIQEDTASVTYWHVEVEKHDVLLAEGLPAESYLDVGNRSGFSTMAGTSTLHPELDGTAARPACASIVRDGDTLIRVRQRLLDRAPLISDVRCTTNPDLQLIADGRTVHPSAVEGDLHRFEVPQGCGMVRLISRVWTPAHADASSLDFRTLGACVHRVVNDGVDVPLTALAGQRGWHDEECNSRESWCWTKGDADLQVGRCLDILLGGGPIYLCDQPAVTLALEAA